MDVTLVITSCRRHDLLKKTVESFVAMNTYPLNQVIIIEDSDLPCPEWMPEGVRWINTGGKGQTYCIDRAYSEVTTPYIFHCEDDWEFVKPSFIEASRELLIKFPEVWSVNLRSDDCNGHPLVEGESYMYLQPYWCEGWGGMSFNPGLRRLSDYKKLGSYGRHLGYGTHGFEAELELSIRHLDEGRRIASLAGLYVRHIGEGRSIAADATKAPRPPKVLIAIPACHKYSYDDQSDGRVHKNQISNERVDAVRATWAKYLPPFTNVTMKFFYGKTDSPREPLADEVFLDVADDYKHLPHKVKAIFQYAIDNDFDFVFKGDDDTFIYVDRLMASGFDQHDYTGFVGLEATNWDNGGYCSGGSGYWVSRRAMDVIARTPVDDWAEDRWVGRVLEGAGIKWVRDARYLPGFWEHFVDVDAIGDDHSYITMHACTPPMMSKLFAKTLPPNFRRVQRAFHEGDQPKTAVPLAATRGNIEVEGIRFTMKHVYAEDKLTIDWWDSHKRVE